MTNKSNKLVVFQNKSIRRVLVENEWFFSVVDVIAVLTDSVNPRDYWFKMKKRVHSEDGIELSTLCRQLKLESSDGKKYSTDCANVKGMFRIIQSIPSPKAEPFKQWLAQVGYERVLEIENPELAQDRMKELYEQKGYPKDWIDKRLRGIAIRQNLTDEWKERGITEENTQKVEEYLENRAFDDAFYVQQILHFTCIKKSASRSDIRKWLKDKLSNALTDEQKESKIGNLLSVTMRGQGLIHNVGGTGHSVWQLTPHGSETCRKNNPECKRKCVKSH